MINLKNIKNQKLNKINTIEVLFYTFPISFILGNLIVSLHLLIFIIFSFLIIKDKKLIFRFDISNWLFILFFLYLSLSTSLQIFDDNFFNDTQKFSAKIEPIIKSILLVRFLILIFLLDTLIYNKVLNFKKFFLVSLICTSFLSIDLIIQYYAGYDLFGFKSLGWRNSGPFGDELIAGTYLQRFSFFSIFYFILIFNNKKFYIPLLIILIILHATGTLLAGNRMPMLLFLFGFVLIIIFSKTLRFTVTAAFITFIAIFFIIGKNDNDIKNRYTIFINALNFIEPTLNYINEKKLENRENLEEEEVKKIEDSIKEFRGKKNFFVRTSGHKLIYMTAIEVWKKQPLFGYGLKSFRVKCWEIYTDEERQLILDEGRPKGCSNHTHQYYLHLLVEAGIIGTIIMIIYFLWIMIGSLKLLNHFNFTKDNRSYFLIPCILVLFLEMWTLRSSGSFFTTWNATFIWLNVAMLIAIKNEKN